MKKSKFTESQIVGILKEQESGKAVADICREHGISQGTFYQWKAKYAGVDVSQLTRMKELGDAAGGELHERCCRRRVERRPRNVALHVDVSYLRFDEVQPGLQRGDVMSSRVGPSSVPHACVHVGPLTDPCAKSRNISRHVWAMPTSSGRLGAAASRSVRTLEAHLR